MTDLEIKAVFLRALGEVAPEADLAALGMDADLRDALDIDSMDVVRLLGLVSRALDVEIPEADTPRLLTLRGALTYLAGRKATPCAATT